MTYLLSAQLLKNWRPLDGPEVPVNKDRCIYCLLLTIIRKFKRTTLPSFNRIKSQMDTIVIVFGL